MCIRPIVQLAALHLHYPALILAEDEVRLHLSLTICRMASNFWGPARLDGSVRMHAVSNGWARDPPKLGSRLQSTGDVNREPINISQHRTAHVELLTYVQFFSLFMVLIR